MLKAKGYIRDVEVNQDKIEVSTFGDTHKSYVAGLRRTTMIIELTEFSDIQDIYSMIGLLPVELHFSEEDVTLSKKLKESKEKLPVPIYRRMRMLRYEKAI